MKPARSPPCLLFARHDSWSARGFAPHKHSSPDSRYFDETDRHTVRPALRPRRRWPVRLRRPPLSSAGPPATRSRCAVRTFGKRPCARLGQPPERRPRLHFPGPPPASRAPPASAPDLTHPRAASRSPPYSEVFSQEMLYSGVAYTLARTSGLTRPFRGPRVIVGQRFLQGPQAHRQACPPRPATRIRCRPERAQCSSPISSA